MKADSNRNVFEGVKVLDFGQVLAGPLSTSYLAKWGATVVRVETESRPDMTRTSAPYKDGIPGVNRSGSFAFINANKYNITVNMKHPKGMDVIYRLVKWADIVSENFTPGTMERLGIGDKKLRELNSSIIITHLSNQGQTGPQSDRRGFGIQLVSHAGFTNMTGFPDSIPYCSWLGYTDLIVPRFAAISMIAALAYQRRTGKGVVLDLSQFEASLHFLAPLLLATGIHGREPARIGNTSPDCSPHGVYQCKGNDRWLALSVHNDVQWESLCQALGRSEWLADARFLSFIDRKRNERELDTLINKRTLDFKAEDLMKLLQQNGVPCGVVQNHEDLLQDPQLQHRDFWWWMNHPEIGEYPHLGSPVLMSRTPAKATMPAPCLGEHNQKVCLEMLKMTEEEFDSLLVEGVFS